MCLPSNRNRELLTRIFLIASLTAGGTAACQPGIGQPPAQTKEGPLRNEGKILGQIIPVSQYGLIAPGVFVTKVPNGNWTALDNPSSILAQQTLDQYAFSPATVTRLTNSNHPGQPIYQVKIDKKYESLFGGIVFTTSPITPANIPDIAKSCPSLQTLKSSGQVLEDPDGNLLFYISPDGSENTSSLANFNLPNQSGTSPSQLNILILRGATRVQFSSVNLSPP